MSLLSKIAKTAAILVAAVFVLALVAVGAYVGAPIYDAFARVLALGGFYQSEIALINEVR